MSEVSVPLLGGGDGSGEEFPQIPVPHCHDIPVELARTTPRKSLIELFFRTPIMNHVDFLKHISLMDDRGDNLLLVEALEAMIRLQTTGEMYEAPEVEQFQSFYDFHEPGCPKNPKRVLMVLPLLRAVEAEDTPNIYQAMQMGADHGKDPRTKFFAWVSLILQVVFLLVIATSLRLEHLDPDIFKDVMICVLALASSFYFWVQAMQKRVKSETYAELYNTMHYPRFWIQVDYVMNVVIASFLPIFNVLWLALTSNTPSGAILNAVTLLFITEIDDDLTTITDMDAHQERVGMDAHGFIIDQDAYDELRCQHTVYRVNVQRIRPEPTEADERAPVSQLCVRDRGQVYCNRVEGTNKLHVTIITTLSQYRIVYLIDDEEMWDSISKLKCVKCYNDIQLPPITSWRAREDELVDNM